MIDYPADWGDLGSAIPDVKTPRAGKIMFALVMSRGLRIQNHMGGLIADEITGQEWLRQLPEGHRLIVSPGAAI